MDTTTKSENEVLLQLETYELHPVGEGDNYGDVVLESFLNDGLFILNEDEKNITLSIRADISDEELDSIITKSYSLRDTYAENSEKYAWADTFCIMLESVVIWRSYKLEDNVLEVLQQAKDKNLINFYIKGDDLLIYFNDEEKADTTWYDFKVLLHPDVEPEIKKLLSNGFYLDDPDQTADFIISIDYIQPRDILFLEELYESKVLDFSVYCGFYFITFNMEYADKNKMFQKLEQYVHMLDWLKPEEHQYFLIFARSLMQLSQSCTINYQGHTVQ
tara:strand:+ start:2771 stop:3595 length:825 start_codon:yes stop_codon:yes gene_type:complete